MIGILYYIAYLICGVLICAMIFDDYKRHQIFVIGLSIGTILCAWLPTAISLLAGYFNETTNIIAILILFIITIILLVKNKNEINIFRFTWQKKDVEEEISMLLCVLPFLFITTWLFSGHVLLPVDGALYGGQSTYGDLSMHMGMVTSIARQGIFPPEYSILPGARLSYPFLVNSLSASLYLFKTSLRTAIILPSVIMSFVCFSGFYLLAKKFTGKNKSAVIAVLLFFITGGLGVVYFLGDIIMFKEIFTGFYKTPVNLPDLNLRWVNVICDMMVPQRTTLMGWSVLIPIMLILYNGMKKKLDITREKRGILADHKELLVAGIMAGLLPMMHTHSFLALGILCAGMLIAGLFVPSIDKKKYVEGFFAFVAPVIILAPPQLFYWVFTQTGGFVRFNLDWVNNSWSWFKFWVINVGLPFILIIPALIWGRKKYLIPFCGAILVYVIAETVAFQPNLYDNNKLLLVWYMIMCIMIGDFIVFIFDKIKIRPLKYISALLFAVVLFTSGGLSIIREVMSNGEYQLYSKEHVEAAQALDDTVFEDALILTGKQHLNAPAALAGRNIYAGAATYLYFHGFDLTQKHNNIEMMYKDSERSAGLLEQEGIDYIYYSSYERYFYGDTQAMFEIYPIVFQNHELSIYAVSARAMELGNLLR
ncbi:MAG: hypothetical protein KAQ68_08265 [Clostridiales bacterium]|nr:hypothetical protein [Clostridiales bacterium]